MPKPEKTIEGWEIRRSPGGYFYLESHVQNEDGTWNLKFTSRVLKIDFESMTAETNNTIYRLGRMKER